MSTSQFKPAWWLPGAHLQTLWPTFCRRKIKNIPLEHERFELPDGDFLDLSWVGKRKNAPLVIVLHGLEGSVASPYAQGILHAVNQCNWRALFMHFRGCSGEHNRLPRSYHSGDTADLNVLVDSIRRNEPNTPIAAIGFSLGGNVLLKWLGETEDKNPLCAAVAVSVPFELNKAADRIQSGFSRLYQRHFLKCLRNRLSEKFQQQTPPFELAALSNVKSMWEFDDKVTAPLHGFSGVQEYYSTSSSRKYLHKIKVPTLLVHAKDDPFMTPDAIPEAHELSSHIRLEVSEGGGHVGFITGELPWRARYWVEERAQQFFKEFF